MQADFYREALSTEMAVRKVNEICEGFESHGQYYDDKGEFLPLSVWGVRGYDTAMIEQNTPDHLKKWDAQVG